MTSQFSDVIHGWLGWCPNTPALRTAPAVLMARPEMIHAGQPDGIGPAGRPGRVRQGVSIAAGSLKTMVRNRYLLGFSFLAGLMMFLLIVAKVWDVQHWWNTLPFHLSIPVGKAFLVLDPWLFLVETICLLCFTILLAGLVLHRDANRKNVPATFREGFSGARTYAGPLAILSIELALIATVVFEILYQTDFFTDVIYGNFLLFFWMPNEYIPYGDVSVFFISLMILFINIPLFLVALFLVPVIVPGDEGLIPALAGSVNLIKKTWCEILGFILVYGTIILGVAAAGLLVIDQLPPMLYRGYEATVSGHPFMMVVYYGFILVCSIIMAAGFTAAGVAIADLYRATKSNRISGIPGGDVEKPGPAS